MKKTLLLFNFTDKSQLSKLNKAAIINGFRTILVDKENYLQPLGCLAGIKEISAAEEKYTGEDFKKEMLVFVNITNSDLNLILSSMKKQGVKKIDYKAVLTPVNISWTAVKLYGELAAEHKAMTKNRI